MDELQTIYMVPQKQVLQLFYLGFCNQIKRKDIRIITVLPGFVDTKMTHNFKLPRILTAQPWEVAEAIWQAVKKREISYT